MPADYFGRMTDFAFGSSFGLIEHQARMSAMPAGYRRDIYGLFKQSPNSPHVFSPPGSPGSNLPTLPDGETEIYGFLPPEKLDFLFRLENSPKLTPKNPGSKISQEGIPRYKR